MTPPSRTDLWIAEAARLRRFLDDEVESRYNDSRRYELPIVESRTAGSDCSYQSDSAVPHPRGMSS